MTDPKPPNATKGAEPEARKPQKSAAERRGPIRNTLESIGMAVLMAVLLKYFALEAYVIPTPSMQPTMMGSPEAGESDRILVDKIYYHIHEPKRWDIAVFRYPVRQVQSYVKRIVGVGGDRLKIAGGNLYNVAENDTVQVLRKPERVQRTLWREMYPMRRKLELFGTTTDPDSAPKKSDVFGRHFRGRRDQNWTIDGDGAFVGKPVSGKTIRLSYNEVRNNYTDGYDLGVADTLRKGRNDVGDYAVQDVALDFELTPDKAPERVAVEVEIAPSNVTLGLEIANGQAKLVAQRKTMPVKKLESEPFPFELPIGEATHIRFEHLDDTLIAFRDGEEVQRLEVDDMRILDEITINAQVAKDTDAVLGRVTPRITVVGQGSSKFAEVRVERDLHYTRSSLPKDKLIEVPANHFFMMGDNTLGSADGRDWTALEIGVKDGSIVPPKTPGARVLWGNKRPKAFGAADPPHDDDNPVPMMTTDDVVFVDAMGQFHALQGKVDKKGGWAQRSEKYPEGRVEFLSEPPFIAAQKPAMFVPREHIQGRPVARFLRSLGGLKFTAWIR